MQKFHSLAHIQKLSPYSPGDMVKNEHGSIVPKKTTLETTEMSNNN